MREKGFIQAIKKIEKSLEKSIMANLQIYFFCTDEIPDEN